MPKEPRSRTLVLKKGHWTYQPSQPLAKGAFGRVFPGASTSGEPVAVKQLDPTGLGIDQRELRIADLLHGHNYQHIIPILDHGIDVKTGGYFIVMPRAERDLHEFTTGPHSQGSALEILKQIALGLSESPVIHRDLKPRNVLFHDGAWKIADFGIARFVEEGTSAHTLKQHMSPEYAAPEQWRTNPSTRATDIYAFGCIAHFLLSGRPPFDGPDRDDFFRQHTESVPPVLPVDDGVQQFVARCLSKVPESRPDIKSVLGTIQRLTTSGSAREVNSSLLRVGAMLTQERLTREAAAAAEQKRQDHRKALIKAAALPFDTAIKGLMDSIKAAIPDATFHEDIRELHAGLAVLYCRRIGPIEESTFKRSNRRIVAGGLIGVTQLGGNYRGQSANLWYADWEDTGSYRWWEVGYLALTGGLRDSPFGVDLNNVAGIDAAHGPAMHTVQIDGLPVPIDAEHQDSFLKRWEERFAAAALAPSNSAVRW